MELSKLLEQNRANHYKLLVIVDNSNNHHKIIDPLKDEGWEAFNVNRNALRLMSNVPMDKIKLRIADEIKKWVLSPVSYTHLDVYKRQVCGPRLARWCSRCERRRPGAERCARARPPGLSGAAGEH